MRDRNGALFVGVSLVAGFGSTAMSLVAAVWVMSLTGSPSLAGLAGLCVFFPTLFGPLLGVAVDRLPRRGLLIGTSLVMAGLLLLLVAVRSPAQVWLVYAVMTGYGVSYVLLDAGETALLPAAVRGESLGGINGLRMSAQEGTKLVAPAVGTGLFAWAGGAAVAVLAAVTLIVAAALYAAIRAADEGTLPAPDTAPGRAASVREGLRFLRTQPVVRGTVLAASVAMLASGLTNAAMFAVVVEGLHRPATFLGLLGSVQGAGSILAGLAAGRLLHRYGETALGAAGAALFGIGTAIRCVPWLPAVVASNLVVGVGLPWAVIAAMTAVQLRTPAGLLGRVGATATSLVFAPPALSIPVGAALVAVVDYRVPIAAAAVAGFLAAGRLSARTPATRPGTP